MRMVYIIVSTCLLEACGSDFSNSFNRVAYSCRELPESGYSLHQVETYDQNTELLAYLKPSPEQQWKEVPEMITAGGCLKKPEQAELVFIRDNDRRGLVLDKLYSGNITLKTIELPRIDDACPLFDPNNFTLGYAKSNISLTDERYWELLLLSISVKHQGEILFQRENLKYPDLKSLDFPEITRSIAQDGFEVIISQKNYLTGSLDQTFSCSSKLNYVVIPIIF